MSADEHMSYDAALARRYYLHVKHGSALNEGDLSRMVQAIEKRDAEIQRLRDVEAEYAAWRAGKIGVEEYYALRVECGRIRAELQRAQEKLNQRGVQQ